MIHPAFVALTVFAVTCSQYVITDASDYSYALYGRTYRFATGDDRKTGDAARIQCAGEGASLVDIRSYPEAEHLAGAVRTMGIPVADRRFLVGGTYKHSIWDSNKATWHYEDNDVMLYTNWSPGQPINGANRKCIMMVAADFNGKWRNVGCSQHTYHYICAKDESSVFKYSFYGKTYFVPHLDSHAVNGVEAARHRCKNYGGVLVDIHSADELQHLKRIVVGMRKPHVKISTQRFAIGGRKVNGSWIYENGTEMTLQNWISGEKEKDGCVTLDINHLAEVSTALSPMEARNYRAQSCDTTSVSYICSKNANGMYMHFADTDDQEGSEIIRNCTSYTEGVDKMEFALIEPDYGRITRNPWHWAKYPTSVRTYPTTRTTKPYTGVSQKQIAIRYKSQRDLNGLLLFCEANGNSRFSTARYRLTVTYPPAGITITYDTKNVTEGENHVITVTSTESFPQSEIIIEFKPKNTAVISHKQKINRQKYTGFMAVSTITFVPHRSDNGKLITVRVTNKRFPTLTLSKSVPFLIDFETKIAEISSAQTEAGIKTSTIIAITVSVSLGVTVMLLIYVGRRKGPVLCLSKSRRVIIERRHASEVQMTQIWPQFLRHDDGTPPPPYEMCVSADNTPRPAPTVCGTNDTSVPQTTQSPNENSETPEPASSAARENLDQERPGVENAGFYVPPPDYEDDRMDETSEQNGGTVSAVP